MRASSSRPPTQLPTMRGMGLWISYFSSIVFIWSGGDPTSKYQASCCPRTPPDSPAFTSHSSLPQTLLQVVTGRSTQMLEDNCPAQGPPSLLLLGLQMPRQHTDAASGALRPATAHHAVATWALRNASCPGSWEYMDLLNVISATLTTNTFFCSVCKRGGEMWGTGSRGSSGFRKCPGLKTAQTHGVEDGAGGGALLLGHTPG